MALAPDTRLGPYHILSPLGVGGMGEVYRARDSRLDRATALLWRERSNAELLMATHDAALGMAARASGLRVIGV